jgi:hypothetical protein
LFAKLDSLRYAFGAHIGATATEPFNAINEVQNEIISAAGVLIKITYDGDVSDLHDRGALANALGWGMVQRPDDIDRKIEKAVQDIEALCRPVLSATWTK